ncbi:MAG: TfoX/Sxy family protein [Gammaproteobacteria bacterium]|nr:TfoX/Sxy family protein [Gammaproteobacteria bacterium]
MGSIASGQIRNLRNLGPRSEKMLAKADIATEKRLKSLGAVRAYVAVKRAGAKPSLNLLWALKGALTNRDWKEIARTRRFELLTELELTENPKKRFVTK